MMMQPKKVETLPVSRVDDAISQLMSPTKHQKLCSINPSSAALVLLAVILLLGFLGYHKGLDSLQYRDDVGDRLGFINVRLRRPRTEGAQVRGDQQTYRNLTGINTKSSGDDDRGSRCKGKWIYVYPLPREFNEDLVDKCGRLTGNWVPLCGRLENGGFGPSIDPVAVSDSRRDDAVSDSSSSGLLRLVPPHAWYRTEQFSLELLFHERLKHSPCLTDDAELAAAFYIPYYGAMDTAFTLFSPHLHVRDRLSQRLVGWLSGSPAWIKFHQTRPHFMVLGRISWDFSRNPESLDGWGTTLLSISELQNVTKLLIERKDWTQHEVAVPYPTSFHPSSDEDMRLWQEELLAQPKREWLATFIGSRSRGTAKSKELRAALSKQCEGAAAGAAAGGLQRGCRELNCGWGGLDCAGSPERVTALFRDSVFCLEPTGDSPTRKGIFDSLVAGCIPVLFSNSSAYTQYTWHLPRNGSLYSVLFDADDVVQGRVDVLSTLAHMAQHETPRLRLMQEAIVRMLPAIVYSQPINRTGLTFPDAVDVALENIVSRLPPVS